MSDEDWARVHFMGRVLGDGAGQPIAHISYLTVRSKLVSFGSDEHRISDPRV